MAKQEKPGKTVKNKGGRPRNDDLVSLDGMMIKTAVLNKINNAARVLEISESEVIEEAVTAFERLINRKKRDQDRIKILFEFLNTKIGPKRTKKKKSPEDEKEEEKVRIMKGMINAFSVAQGYPIPEKYEDEVTEYLHKFFQHPEAVQRIKEIRNNIEKMVRAATRKIPPSNSDWIPSSDKAFSDWLGEKITLNVSKSLWANLNEPIFKLQYQTDKTLLERSDDADDLESLFQLITMDFRYGLIRLVGRLFGKNDDKPSPWCLKVKVCEYCGKWRMNAAGNSRYCGKEFGKKTCLRNAARSPNEAKGWDSRG